MVSILDQLSIFVLWEMRVIRLLEKLQTKHVVDVEGESM